MKSRKKSFKSDIGKPKNMKYYAESYICICQNSKNYRQHLLFMKINK